MYAISHSTAPEPVQHLSSFLSHWINSHHQEAPKKRNCARQIGNSNQKATPSKPNGQVVYNKEDFMHKTSPTSSDIVTHGAQSPSSRKIRIVPLTAAMVLSIFLSACANIQALMGFEKAAAPSGRVIPVHAELWNIRFQPDPHGDSGSPVVFGEILIQKQGHTVQTIAHSVHRASLLAEDDSWLQVVDVNNDSLPDLLIAHASPVTRPLKSLYLFDSTSQSFQPQEQLTKLGEIDKLSGCVVLTSDDDKAPQRTFCLSMEQPGWTEVKLPSSVSLERCNMRAQSLAECRSMRTQRDLQMRTLVGSYITTRSEDMAVEKRKAAAQRFARNLRIGHQQWLQYRDARCASYVIEHNFPADSSKFEMESCKLDLSALQLQHYTSMLAALEK
jgi:hypothetical protein